MTTWKWNYLVSVKIKGPDPYGGRDQETGFELEMWAKGVGFEEALSVAVEKAMATAKALDEAAAEARAKDRSAHETGPEGAS